MKTLLSLIGLVMIIEGLPYFISPQRAREVADIINKLDDNALRVIGFSLMVAGVAVVAMVRLWLFPDQP